MSEFQGQVALVTGSARGMGRSHARLLAERGADIVVHDILVEEAEATAELVRAAGRRAHVMFTDITDVAAMRAAVGDAEDRLGGIDILVNNAGIGADRAGVEEIDEAMFDRMFAVHVKGAFFTTRAVVPGMKHRRSGKIINVASIWGMTGHAFGSTYCAAKAAMLGFTKAWAKEFAPFGITVNAIAPGGVLTPMPVERDGIDAVRERMAKVPLGRWADPEEIAYTVAFLASREANFITGQVISPNGGETIVSY
jgi:3-oxoacyl-[acyl-carrier protein] reductase